MGKANLIEHVWRQWTEKSKTVSSLYPTEFKDCAVGQVYVYVESWGYIVDFTILFCFSKFNRGNYVLHIVKIIKHNIKR